MKNYRLLGKEISGPFTIPAGIVATEVSVLKRIADEIPEVGILTTKSIGPEPKEGNKEPIIAQFSPFSFVNAVGLTNPGADEFARRLSGIKFPEDKFLLVSIFGSNETEFKDVAEKLYAYADAFELNVSCPHSGKYGQAVGQDKELIEKVVRNVVKLGKPVFIKISPNLDVQESLKYALKGGISGITAINTEGPKEYCHNGSPVLSNKVGGMSGRAILETGLNCVKAIRRATELPIIGCGGISTAKDVNLYRAAGADFFGIGSALAGMDTLELKGYFQSLLEDVNNNTNKAEDFLQKDLNMGYVKFTVKENRRLAEDLFLLVLNEKIEINPGQFIFAWLPGRGEKPFSAFDDEPLSLLVRKKGFFTNELLKLNKGDVVYIRGPYGNYPKVKGKILLVAGGTGIAALSLFAKRNKEVYAVLGAKNKQNLPYKCFERFCRNIFLCTDSGELGHKGLVTDTLDEIMEEVQPDYCLNCGPEQMIKAVIQKEIKYLTPDKIYSSVELLTKCGIGLCGSCATSGGHRSCVDGTFFNSQL